MKKTYAKPTITEHGDIQAITRSGFGRNLDGGHGLFRGTGS